MKKLIFTLSAVIIIFGVFMGFEAYQNVKAQKVNPYGEKEVSMQTLQQAEDDPFYQNVVLPEQLKGHAKEGQNEVVYFFSPVCSYCNDLEPILKEMVNKYSEINFSLYNVHEFREESHDYHLEGTPTLIYFKDGKEVKRLVGYEPKEEVEKFFLGIN